MKYAQVTYTDENRECGAVYWGVTDKEEAKERFRKEFPERANFNLSVKIYE